MGQGGGGGGECSGPDGGGAGTQERPAVEHEHVCSPLFDLWSFENGQPVLITETIFYNMIDREYELIHAGFRAIARLRCRG
jgi:hypothetical protein